MKPTFLKKNTKGGAGGVSWEAGEVKEVSPAFAELLVVLSPEDYEIVQEGEPTPEPPAHKTPGLSFPSISSDGTGIEFNTPATTNIEVPVENEEAPAPKRPGRPKKSDQATETHSAE